MKTTNRTSLLLVFKSVLSLFALCIAIVITHEVAHYVTALILGIRIAHFAWFNSNYLAPAFTSASTEHTVSMKIVGYSGGLATGILLMAVLIFKKHWFKQSVFRWLLGFYMVALGLWQISQGIFEGAFNDIYIANATLLFSSPIHYIGYASGLLGMVLYWLLMPRIRDLKV